MGFETGPLWLVLCTLRWPGPGGRWTGADFFAGTAALLGAGYLAHF